MASELLKHTLLFWAWLLVQVLVLNNVAVGGVVPQIYLLYLLTLPFETPKWLLLALGFGLGLSIDLFTDSVGVHTSACLWMALARPLVLDLVGSREGYETGTLPRMRDYGLVWFLRYAGTLTLVHHLVLYLFLEFSFAALGKVLSNTLLGGFLSMSLMVVLQLFAPSVKPRKKGRLI